VRLGAALTLAAAGTTATAAQTITFPHQGGTRSYLAHLPPAHGGGSAPPLLIALHGTSMRAADMLVYTDLVALADREGVVLVAPSAIDNAFNDGLARAGSAAAAVDDVGFVEAVAEDARLRFGARADSIFAVGFSNGGSMVQRLAIESGYPFAGFAAVASAVRVPTAGVLRPAPMLLVFGNADPLNPPAGGWVWIPVPHVKPAPKRTATQWAERLRCAGPPDAETPAAGVLARHWRDCAAGARLAWLTIDGLGHHWAGARPMPFPSFVIGPQVDAPKLGDLVWQFFSVSASRTSSAAPAAISAAPPPAAPPAPGRAPPPGPAAAR
jgi:polyhydroxybutyrate depolymerase